MGTHEVLKGYSTGHLFGRDLVSDPAYASSVWNKTDHHSFNNVSTPKKSTPVSTPCEFPGVPFGADQTIIAKYDDTAEFFGAGTAAELGIRTALLERAHALYPEAEVGTPSTPL